MFQPPAVISQYIITLITVLLITCCISVSAKSLKDYAEQLDIPESHAQLYLNAFPKILAACESTEGQLCAKVNDQRWGYEVDSTVNNPRYSEPKCPGSYVGYVKDKDTQVNTFFTQTDFGFVRQQVFQLRVLCEPNFIHDSSLECTKSLRYCNGRNLYVDLRDVALREEPIRYHMDVLKQGQIGGYCHLHGDTLRNELGHMSALQSWAPEMRFFERLRRRPFEPVDDADEEPMCDVTVERPTIVMKLDASVNMYHHFCDFFNLYASLHVNSTGNAAMYSRDVNILVWETHHYKSAFGETFKAFTEHPVMDLTAYQGKRVCFRNVMFPLLPRMIFGLYYNTPIINGCRSSGLFRAFSEFILHRLRIPLHLPPEDEIPAVRVTFLSRKTRFRNVVNEDELVAAIRELRGVDVRQVAYSSKMPFRQQLEITRNTDVFIGMHGAGLTHLLFLPDWATIFELYNCGDAGCYRDLARLRGVHYMTWENATKVWPEFEGQHPDGSGAHEKFTNYKFDVREFVRLVKKAVDRVRDHEEYQKFSGVVDTEEDVCRRGDESKQEL